MICLNRPPNDFLFVELTFEKCGFQKKSSHICVENPGFRPQVSKLEDLFMVILCTWDSVQKQQIYNLITTG